MKHIKLFEIFNKVNENVDNYKIGDRVNVISDNENYKDFKDKTLIVTHIAHNTDEHPGYDDSISGELLMDFETEDGEEVNSSLYEYEVSHA